MQVDLSVSPSFLAGPLSITPSLHFQVNTDDLTRITGAQDHNVDDDTKWWGGLTLSWAMDFGATDEEEPTEPEPGDPAARREPAK